ncbi:MAG: hypothetical protein ACTHK7_15170, partial [Aureliella sp.]
MESGMVKRFQFVGYMLMWLCAAPVMAQQGTSTALQVPALIPSDAVGFLTVRPQLLAQHEALKLMPLELVTAAGLDTFGVDPLAIERIDVIFGKPSRGDEPMAAVVTSAVDITPEQITAGLLAPKGAKEEAGIKMYALAKVPDGVAAFVNKRQIVVGPRPFVLQLLTSKAADGELRRQVARMNQADHVSLVIALSPMRELLVEGSGLGDIPRAVQSDIRVLTEKVQVVAARLRLGAEPPVAVAIEAASQADIAAVQSSWNHLVQVATAETMGQAERRIANKNSPSARAAIAYAQRYLA